MPEKTFAELGVDAALVAALARDGITTPFAIQALTIPDALAGRDVCGKAKTGSGKTLAFGLPMLMSTEHAEPGHPRALVLVPTRELCLQVAEVLEPLARTLELRVGTIYGGADLERQVRRIRHGLDLVVATPGRLIDLVDRDAIALDAVRSLVVDEADRMADMGFLPQVEWLVRHMSSPTRQTLLFSATLDAAVNRIVSRYMTDPVLYEVESAQVTVSEMEHRFIKVHELDKALVAAAIIRGADKALVFVRTKRMADRLVQSLRDAKVNARAIHGDLPQSVREQALNGFAQGTIHALVATDVAARGLDIDGLDVVVHYDPPEDHKAYLHRSGRTARAGEAGIVATLVLWNEELAVERLQRRVGLHSPIVEMFSNDPRLSDLTTWRPEGASGVASATRLADGQLYLRQWRSGRDFARGDALAEEMANYAYALGERDSGAAVLVDPAHAPLELAELVAADGMELRGAVLTHFHADHAGGAIADRAIAGVAELVAALQVPVHLHGADREYLLAGSAVASSALVSHADGDSLALGALDLCLLHTPGHTPGSQCISTADLLLTGDTLFLRGCGRTDFAGGDPEALYESLLVRLGSLPDDAIVYPGHAYASAPHALLGELRRTNPVLRPIARDAWVARFT